MERKRGLSYRVPFPGVLTFPLPGQHPVFFIVRRDIHDIEVLLQTFEGLCHADCRGALCWNEM